MEYFERRVVNKTIKIIYDKIIRLCFDADKDITDVTEEDIKRRLYEYFSMDKYEIIDSMKYIIENSWDDGVF